MILLGMDGLLLCIDAVNLTFTALRRLWFGGQVASCAAGASRRAPIAAHRVVQRSARAFASMCVARNDVVQAFGGRRGWVGTSACLKAAARCSPGCC